MAVSCLYLTTTILWLVALRVALTKGQDRVLALNDALLTKNVDRTHKATPPSLSAFTGGDRKRKSIKSEINIPMASKQIGERVSGGRSKRKAIRDLSRRWPNAVVPYKIGRGFSSNDIKIIQEAMNEFSRHTCLKFRRALSTDKDKILFADGLDCSSDVGRVGGTQEVSLEKICRTKRTVIHEIGHAIGFFHEHRRPDRNKYVRVDLKRISDTHRYNFDELPKDKVNTYGVKYDYQSIMHYTYDAGSVDGWPTIRARNSRFTVKLGVTNNLSFRDIQLANLMYDCAGLRNCSKMQCQAVGFQGADCKCKCPSPTRNEKNPTVDCTPMDFKVRRGWPLQHPVSGGNISAVCAFPECDDYRLSQKFIGYWGTIVYKDLPKTNRYKVTATSYNYYRGEAALDKVLYFTIKPIACYDSGVYMCSCQPKNGGPRVSALWHMNVKGC